MLFGTDGIRGIVGKSLTTDVAYKLGRALAIFFGEGAHALIGRDNRTSGQMLECALETGLLEGGINVVEAGILPSPAVSFLARKGSFSFAVMITASHNASFYNGLKVFNSLGEKLGAFEEAEVENIMQNLNNFAAEEKCIAAKKFGSRIFNGRLKEAYFTNLVKLSTGAVSLKQKIVIDCANGAGSEFVKKLVKKVPLNAKIICSKKNGTFINEKCGATNVKKLQRTVKRQKAVAGFALDGDADRLVVVDGSGRKIEGDKVIYSIAKVLKQNNSLSKNTIIATIISNFGLEASLKKHNIKVVRVPVGDSFVAAAIKKSKLDFGGEASGHLIFSNLPCSDGIASMLILLCEIAKNNNFLNEIALDYKPFFVAEQNIEMPREKSALVLTSSHFINVLKCCEESLAKNGRVLVRQSGTEEVLRILVESDCEEESKRILSVLARAARADANFAG